MSRPAGSLQNEISVRSPTGHFALRKLEAIFFTGLQLYDGGFFNLGKGGEVHSETAHPFGDGKY